MVEPVGQRHSRLACPTCRVGQLIFDQQWATCDQCGHRTPSAYAAELLSYESSYATLFARRSWLQDQVAAGTASPYLEFGLRESTMGQPWRTQADAFAAPAASATQPPPPSYAVTPTSITQLPVPVSSPAREQVALVRDVKLGLASTLYIIGAVLFVAALIGAATLSWQYLGEGGRAVLFAFAALALAGGAHFARNRVYGLSETLAVLAGVTVPVAILVGTVQAGATARHWSLTYAATGGAVFSLAAWGVSRINAYAWVGVASAELTLFAIAGARSSTALTFTSAAIVILGSALVVEASLLTRNRAYSWATVSIGGIGLAVGTLLSWATIDPSHRVIARAAIAVLAGLATVALQPAWRRRNLAVAMYIGWVLVFVGVTTAPLASNFASIDVYMALPLLAGSFVLLLWHSYRPQWPTLAIPIVASIALIASQVMAIPGLFSEGTQQWQWRVYSAGAALLIVLLGAMWRRIGADFYVVSVWAGWLLLTVVVATAGLMFVHHPEVPDAWLAAPLLAWSCLLLTISSRFTGLTNFVTVRVSVATLAISCVACVFAFAPTVRASWTIYALVCVIALMVFWRRLLSVGIPVQALSYSGAATLAIPFGIAVVYASSPGRPLTYWAAVAGAVIGGLVLNFATTLRRWSRGWDVPTFAVATWVTAGLTILTELQRVQSSSTELVMSTFVLIVAASLAVYVVVHRTYVIAWIAASVFAVGWTLLTRNDATNQIELTTLFIALALLAAGLTTWGVREQRGAATSSYSIFTPAIVVGVFPSVVAYYAVGINEPGTRWLTLVLVCTALTVAGALWRLGGIVVPAIVALVAVVTPVAFAGGRQVLTVLPAWGVVAILGVVLILVAARLEWLRNAGRGGRRWFASLT